MSIDLEREKERKEGGRERSAASYMQPMGDGNLGMCPTGFEPVILWYIGCCFNQLSYTSRAKSF